MDGKREASFSVPVVVLRIANAVLPSAAVGALASRDLNVRQLLEARSSGSGYRATLNVRERGLTKKIVVSLE